MARPRIVDVDYFQFQRALQRAMDTGQKIDQADRDRWLNWVRENRVKEAAFRSFGEGKYEGLKPVILDTEDTWGGYYLVSQQEEACLKWQATEGGS